MKLTVSEKIKNPAMEREEIVFLVDHTGEAQPSRARLEEAFEVELNKKRNVFAIKRVTSFFGTSVSSVRVNVYANEEKRNYFEPKHLLKKGAKKEAAGTESA